MTTWFTSDTHFGDHRTLNIWKRPFASTAEMDARLVAEWNGVVAPDDTVWHLGDFARTPAVAARVLPQLHGTKHLLLGNNDPGPQPDGWASVQAYRELQLGDRDLVLCHYPFRTWNGAHRGALNLHGHSHGRLKPLLRQYDVGVDARGWRPVTLGELTGA